MSRQLVWLPIAIAAISLSGPTFAGASTIQDPPGRPRQQKPAQTPVTEPPVNQWTTPIQQPDEEMRRALTNLSTQIGLLTDELQRLRQETERNSGTMELLLNEDRLAKVEDKIQDALNYKAQLDAREQDIQRRMKNIQGELVLRGGIRRDESEAVLRAEFQRSLDDVRTQQAAHQQRIAELTAQGARLEARVETLRKKLEIEETKAEKKEKK